ncbi:O-antigen ligase family protein [Pseudalkalibacillus sp. Hm43]|uniref:O-antigen ligase family protein n=1 Tax=Pseudalkalibacillus sp. Hm43 TaxID=3450742 RepID=UPI003F43E02E
MNFRSKFDHLRNPFLTTIIVTFCIYLGLVQFTTSYPYIHMLPIPTPAVLTLGMAGLFIVYHVLYGLKEQGLYISIADRYMKYFIYAFVLSIILSIFSALFTASVVNSVEFVSYLKKSLITRMLYYIAFIGMTYFGYKTLSKLDLSKIKKIVNVYPISILLITAIGIWQLLYFLFNVPFLNIETRSFVHSVGGLTLFDFRLTSFADEPSYLGPIIIDMVIVGYLLFKRKWIYVIAILIPALIVLIFSFSVAVYFNLLIMFGILFLFILFHPKVPKKYIWMFLGLSVAAVAVAILVKPELFAKFFSPILNRENLFDPEHSSRIYMYLMPLFWLFDHSVISALFGYGPGAFEFISETKILPKDGSRLNVSSNNMYIDLLFEHGIIGFTLIMAAAGYLFFNLLKRVRRNIYFLIAFLELMHLLVTSLYRSDFVTPRFWGVLLIVFLLTKIGEVTDKEKEM